MTFHLTTHLGAGAIFAVAAIASELLDRSPLAGVIAFMAGAVMAWAAVNLLDWWKRWKR